MVKKFKKTKTKISNSNSNKNKNNIHITIHNSEKNKKRRRAKTTTNKSKHGEYTPKEQNPSGYTNTVTLGNAPEKPDKKLEEQVFHYNNRLLGNEQQNNRIPLEIDNQANNVLIEKVQRLENGANVLLGEVRRNNEFLKTQKPKQEKLEWEEVEESIPVKVEIPKRGRGRPAKIKTTNPTAKIEKQQKDDLNVKPLLSTPEGTTQENELNKMIFSTDLKKPTERKPVIVYYTPKDEPISKAQKSIDSVLYRGADFLSSSEFGNSAQKEQAMNDLYSELMANQKKIDFQADLQDAGIKVRKKRVPYTPS